MKKGVIRILSLVLILVALLALSACNSTTSSSTTSSQTFTATISSVVTSTASSSTATSSTPLKTFGAMAALGKTIFDNYGTSSHGENGQGGSAPALIGGNANLAKFNTAEGLLNFISASMPLEASGSLSH